MHCCSQLLPDTAASTLLRLLKPRLTQIFPHCDVDMWGRVWMSHFRGVWQSLNFDKKYLFGYESLQLTFTKSYFHFLSSSADGDVEEDERAERERKEENGDEEALQKARDWDDWKDTHRRGYGNRKNMGWSNFTHSYTRASLQFLQINLPMLPICDMDTTENGTVVVS